MIKAFVFGKFLPFHKGHEAMIRFALTKCDFLTVLICCSDKEEIPDKIRKGWIEKTFQGHENVDVQTYNYKEEDLPNTSVTSQIVSNLWSAKFKEILPDCDLIITSEDYGFLVASFMDIRHIPFDIPKKLFPVSSSAIRSDLFVNWRYLPHSVKPYFAIKVAVLGTESTGKTTLSGRLAKHFNCALVSEAGRDLIADSNTFSFNDLHIVAREHANRIEKAVCDDHPLIIIDTDIHITKSYSKFKFGKELEVDDEIYKWNQSNLYLYLTNEVGYEQDGTRLSKTDRDLLDAFHREVLKRCGIDYVEISGNWEERFSKAVACINRITRKLKI